MTDKDFRAAALAHARAHPEDVDLPPHAGVQRVDGGAFVDLCVYIDQSEIPVDLQPRIALVSRP